MQPCEKFSSYAICMKFPEEDLMVYLVKCFSIIKVDHVGVHIILEVLEDILNVGQELSEARFTSLKSMLVRADDSIFN